MRRAARALAIGACIAAASAIGSPASAIEANPGASNSDVQTLRTRSLAATCAACHGTDGRAASGAALPGLAGMPAATLVARMTAYKAGTLTGSVMPQLAQGFSAAQIEQLAGWFAARSPDGPPDGR